MSGFVIGLFALLAWTARTHTPAFEDVDGNVLADSIAEQRYMTLGGVEQYVLIRGRDRRNPVLVFLHGGPGVSAMAFNRVFASDLEQDFIIVNWDQRGTGFSYDKEADPQAISLERLTEDLHALVSALQEEFGVQKVYLVGHSWGSMLGLHYASLYPETLHALVGIGAMADTEAGERLNYDWAMQQAESAGDIRSVERLKAIAPLPYDSPAEMGEHRKIVRLYDGDWHSGSLSDWDYVRIHLRTPEFSWTDLTSILAGADMSNDRLFADLMALKAVLDYPALDVPLIYMLGRHDRIVAPQPAVDYLSQVDAPWTRLVWFDRSGHNPHWEEPERFRREMAAVVDRVRQEVQDLETLP